MSAFVQFEYRDASHNIIGDSSDGDLPLHRAMALFSLLIESPRLRYAAVFTDQTELKMRAVYFRPGLEACYSRERSMAKDNGAVVCAAAVLS